MNIALILQHKLLQGLQRFLTGTPSQAPQPHWRSRALSNASNPIPHAVQTTTFATQTDRPRAVRVMPLRVLRVVESGMPRASAGRLVISGRMADVCAELDRLVERESALH